MISSLCREPIWNAWKLKALSFRASEGRDRFRSRLSDEESLLVSCRRVCCIIWNYWRLAFEIVAFQGGEAYDSGFRSISFPFHRPRYFSQSFQSRARRSESEGIMASEVSPVQGSAPSVPWQRPSWLRPKYLLFGFIALMAAYVAMTSESFLIHP